MALPHLAQLQIRDRAGVDEGLGDDGQTGIHVVRLIDVKHELRVLQNVDPETQR